MSDFYKQVPKDLQGNLEYRLELRRKAADEGFKRALLTACKHDVLFFFNSMCWLYEPRPRIVDGKKLPHQIPFITWEHQDSAILEIKKHLGFEDIGVEKSRGEGASWIAIYLAVQDWLFDPMSAIGLVSRNEDAVDNPEDPDSLFWKIDWGLSKLPRWMAGVQDVDWKRNKADHTLRNFRNDSTITGYSATGDVGTGGRKKWFLKDELSKFPRGPDKEAMASTQHVTNSRLVVSTPKGAEGAYFELMHEPSSLVRITIDWKQNPTRNPGLYTMQDGKPVAVDPVNNPLPASYNPPDREILDLFSRLRKRGFKLEGKLRSPWYDHECDRPGATPQNIAQELDRDYGGSMYRVFGTEFMGACESTVRPALVRGTLSYHPETLDPEFHTVENGEVYLWCPLDHRGRPPLHSFVLGGDVSTGAGGSHSSNSSWIGFDLVTNEQVVEVASNTTLPSDWGDLGIALAKFFHNAYLGWEAPGPGGALGQRVIEKGYPNVYYRTVLAKRGRKKTKEIGWWTGDRSKEVMFEELLRSGKSGEITLRSERLVKECGQYVRVNGKIVHVQVANSQDDSSRGLAHGDLVIGACVALQLLRDRPLSAAMKHEEHAEPPPNTLAARQRAYEDSLREEGDEWDSRTQHDLAQGSNSTRTHRGGLSLSSSCDSDW